MTPQTSVLIIGAGPVGLTLANLLHLHRVSFRIITDEAHQRPVEQSRAEGNHGRTLALYERLGVLDKAFAEGRPLHGAVLHKRDSSIGRIVLNDPNSYYPGALILSQARVERMLEENLKKKGVLVERGKKLIGIRNSADSVEASLECIDGRSEEASAIYLVGCDGGHSISRKISGATFEGEVSQIQYALADVEIDFSGEILNDDLHIWLSPLMIAGRLEGRTWKVAAPTNPETPLLDAPETVMRLIQEKLDENGVRVRLHSPRWTSVFRISTRRVNRMRHGRVFLAGDAAHIHSPMGGQGMNEGMQDALNLSWKLAAVLRGEVGDTLLDSYDEERQPIVAAMLKDTLLMTRLLEMRPSLLSMLRDAVFALASNWKPLQPIIREQFAGATRNLRQSRLVSDPEVRYFSAHTPRPGDRAPDAAGIFANESAESIRLFTLWRLGEKHELLIFTGTNENEHLRDTLSALASQMEAVLKPRIRAWVVTGCGRGTQNFLLDSRGELHQRYGTEHGGYYLLRPDGFIANRGSRATYENIRRFFAEDYYRNESSPNTGQTTR